MGPALLIAAAVIFAVETIRSHSLIAAGLALLTLSMIV